MAAKPFPLDHVRNFGIMAHIDGGKTILEALNTDLVHVRPPRQAEIPNSPSAVDLRARPVTPCMIFMMFFIV